MVKATLSGLEMTHDCIPLVTHPTVDVAPEVTDEGIVVSAIKGLLICTLHCAPTTSPTTFRHPSVYVAVLVPAGGLPMVVVVAPASCPRVSNPPPIESAARWQLYEIAKVEPTSATWD